MKHIYGKNCKQCGDQKWEKQGTSLVCFNCGSRRPYKSRNRGGGKTESQERVIRRLRTYYEHDGINVFKVEMDTGYAYVTIETGEGIYTQGGGHFRIGRRGKLEILSLYDVLTADERKAHLEFTAEMLGGHVA